MDRNIEKGRGKENYNNAKVNNGVIFIPKKKLIDDDKNITKNRKTPSNSSSTSSSFPSSSSSLSPSKAPSSSSAISAVHTSSSRVREQSDENDGLIMMDGITEDVTVEKSVDSTLEVQGGGEGSERYWTCAACTFSNDCETDSRKCCMCDARRVGMIKRNSESGGEKSEKAIERKEVGADRSRDTDRDRDRNRDKDRERERGTDRESGGKRKIPFGDSLATLHTAVSVHNHTNTANTANTDTSTSTTHIYENISTRESQPSTGI